MGKGLHMRSSYACDKAALVVQCNGHASRSGSWTEHHKGSCGALDPRFDEDLFFSPTSSMHQAVLRFIQPSPPAADAGCSLGVVSFGIHRLLRVAPFWPGSGCDLPRDPLLLSQQGIRDLSASMISTTLENGGKQSVHATERSQ